MFIGLLGALVGISLFVWQVFETKKHRLLDRARSLYEDRTIRYEGKVRLEKSPFATLREGEDHYLSIFDGAVCLTSATGELRCIDAARITTVASNDEGEDTVLQIRFADDRGTRLLVFRTKPARAKMIERVSMMGEETGCAR
jgi:hypothetical protein